ncbi:related to nitrate assimilation regulatory protein nirA [Phialocephala subalpina]|uniref:Related to nitrate assimilation regulatory protein nirA n=1 Tax=Phialocephala subalpina TaxID=576137 RepID=A0A1L7WNL2_9HELO|nr:related to nitrate assimilation regulatory protein nirA [Phialocephala subalpina]
MSSSQAHVNFQVPDASEFQDPTTAAPIHTDPLDLEQFMMDNSHHASGSLIHTTPPQFADFSFNNYNVADDGMHSDAKLENTADPYTLSGRSGAPDHRGSIASIHPELRQDHRHSITSMPGDHRGSITSIPGGTRASFSGAVGQGGNASLDGSEDASPSSNRAGMDGGYDEFGLNNGSAVDGSDLGTRTKEDKNDSNPPWSELKTKAGKERKRLPLACIACRRKKIRCSGEKPACKHCLRSRIPCVYKVTTRKAAPRTDYMAMLDKRLRRMEERIIKIVPKEEQDGTAVSVTRAAVKPAIPGTIPVKSTAGKKRAADEAFAQELDHWSKSTSHPNLEGGSKPTSVMLQEQEESKLLSEGAEALPSKELQEHLSEVFFENVYGQTYHLLHKPSFMRKLKAGTVPPVLILAVSAVSARFSTHPKLNTTPAFLRGEEWACEARKIVTNRYDWPNITILTCLLILGLHEFGTCQGGRSWAFGGHAVRMAYALQLHRDLDYDPLKRNGTAELSFIDREIRRRTMWACFLMDRFMSAGVDRPTFIKEETIKVQLPIREKYFQLDMPGPTENLKGEVPHPLSPGAGQLSDARDNMGVAAFMVRSIALWGRIINYLNLGGSDEDPHPTWHHDSVYASLLSQTEAFNDTLPDSLKYNKENLHTHETEGLANQFLFLHISIQQNILFMNRFSTPGQKGEAGNRPSSDVPKEFVTKAGTKAFEAANKVSELLHDGESHFITAPFTGYCAFLASTVHVFGVFSNNSAMETASKKNLGINVKYLSKMKRYWGMFHFAAENLKELYRTCADAARQGSSTNMTQSPSNVFQYGDWFDRYPHGVSQSDFEDPATITIKKEKGDDAVLSEKSGLHTVEQFFDTLDPAMTPLERDAAAKGGKRKAKKGQPSRHDQLAPVNTNVPDMNRGPSMQMQNSHHVQQGYNQMSPTTPVNMYNQHQPYYGHEVLLPPHQQGLMPQLDRQLVFGAYAGMDPSSLSSQNMLDSTNAWDMQMGGMAGLVTEPSAQWFMPFNMEPPDLGHDQDIFNAMGGTYALGGMQVDNGGHMGGHGGGN